MRLGIAVATVWLVSAVILAPAAPVEAAGGIQSIGSCQTIDKPGSYVVAKDLQATGDCIVITSSFVTLDLSGYTITGSGVGNGVTNSGQSTDIVVRNGMVTA